ncbi:MAG: hypothetical protein HDR01_01245 [Lachnospiraceae bacterium]|nr:hypothetical protein [Lachnospiraceae bacterium]
MRKVLKAEIQRAVNLGWIIGIIGIIFSICFDSWNDLIQQIKNSNGYVHYFFWNSAFGGMCRTYLLPVFATLPFAASFCKERKNNAIAFIVSREGRKKYCLVKYLVNMLSGGFVVAIGTAILLFMLLLMFPMTGSDYQDVTTADMFHAWAAVNSPMQYCIVEIVLGFCRGIIWSSVALLISLYVNDSFVVTASPYLFSYVFVQLGRLLQINNTYRIDMILIGRTVIKSSWNTVVIGMVCSAIITIFIGIVFVKKLSGELRDGIYY